MGSPPEYTCLLYALSYRHIPVILTVGSPTLAAFSLALTAINTRWTDRRFSAIKYPNSRKAVRALVYLQQVPLRLTTRDGLLASLVVLPENDDWWECLVERLEHTHTWTIAAAASIAWVVVALILAIVDSFVNIENFASDGQGVGSLWLWLLPIVVGWLWIPFSSYERLRTAIDKANGLAFVAASDHPPQSNYIVGGSPSADSSPNTYPPRRTHDIFQRQALGMTEKVEVFTGGVTRTAPVFNYARVWEWWWTVEIIAQAFEHANTNAENHIPVDPDRDWLLPGDRHTIIHRENRTGTIRQVQAYCGLASQGEQGPVRTLPSGAWWRIFVASAFALVLQWGTTGAAIITAVFTPTTGLGCRSGSYILYGAVSTVVWFALLLSSYLAHCSKAWRNGRTPRSGLDPITVAEGLATFLRRLSIFVAGCNTVCVILACVLEFSNYYDTCYCNSSVLGRGAQRAYSLIIAKDPEYHDARTAWAGGFVFAGACVTSYLFFLSLMLEPCHDADSR